MPVAKKKARVRHPWKEWFSKKTLTLTKGKDFKGDIHPMLVQIYRAATKFGVKVSIETNGNKLDITVTKEKK